MSNAAPNAAAAAAANHHRGGDRTVIIPLTSPDLCVRQWDLLFPEALVQKKSGPKLDLDVMFNAINAYCSNKGATIEIDQREANNGMALNSSRNTLHAERAAAAASATTAADLEKYLFFDPSEMKGGAEGGFASYQQLTLHKADSPEAAEHFRRQGFKTFTNVQFHNTTTSGLSNLPTLAADGPQDGCAPVHELPAPAGQVNALPRNMPAFHSGDDSMAKKVAEAFEDKVVDEENNKVWHPLWLWDADARKRFGYKDTSNFTSRLNAYFCVKCGEVGAADLNAMTFGQLKARGKAEYKKKYPSRAKGYYEACVDMYRHNTGN
jgi:hypothetical protein